MKDNNQSHSNSFQTQYIITIICLCILFFTGCSRYQYVTIESYLSKNANNEFVAEDDTVKVTYTFSGDDFPIKLDVFNKLQQPLFLDRWKSKVFMNDVPINDAFDSGSQYSLIKAQSSITISGNNLSDKFIPLSLKDSITNAIIATANGYHKIKLHNFTESNSPVFFSSLLAFSTLENHTDTFFYEHPFWVSGIYETLDVVPSKLPANQFSMHKATDFTTFMTYTGATVLMLGLLAASASTTPAEE